MISQFKLKDSSNHRMDFIFDYDSDQPSAGGDGNMSVNLLPVPALPLNLSNLNSYREDLTQRFSNLNILKNLQQKQLRQDQLDLLGEIDPLDYTGVANKDDEQKDLAQKYAKLSLDLIKGQDDKDSKFNSYMIDGASVPDAAKPTLVLSARLSRVLGTSNFDSGIKELLLLLQTRIQEQQQQAPQHGENDTLLNIDYNSLTDTGLVGSISRRKLRNEIENDLLKQQFQTLKSFQPIVTKLMITKDKLNVLNKLNQELVEILENSATKTKTYQASVSELTKQKDLITLKKLLLKNFQKNYTLTRYEEFHLINDDIDLEYLQILNKAEDIYKNCSILLSMDNPQIGLSIMNEMSEIIQLSTKRIVNFIKKQFQSFFLMGNNSDLDSQEKHSVFKKSLIYVINSKSEYLAEIMEELVNSRSKILVEDFLSQVNGYDESLQGQNNKNKKKNKRDDNRPLMLSIYDSKRFVSDILAYLHDTIVNEKELLNNLFDLEDDIIASYEIETMDTSVKDIVNLVDEVIEKDINVLTKSLRTRIEQIVRSENKLVVLQSMHQLFDLYKIMYSKALKSKKSELINTVAELQRLTLERMLSVTKQKLNIIQHKNKNGQEDEYIEEIDDDLNIPEWLIEFYGIITPLFGNLDSGDDTFMNFSAKDDVSFKEMIFDNVLDIIDVEISQNSLNVKQQSVFKLNCYDFISTKLITLRLMNSKWQILNDKINELKVKLCKVQFDLLLKGTNLQDIYNLINMIFALDNDFFDISIYEPIVENKLFTFKFFKEINFKLMEVLPLALIDYQQEELKKLLSPSIANDISVDSSTDFVNFYYKLWLITRKYLTIDSPNDVDPDNFDKHPVFKWGDMEVATLLGCADHYAAQKEEFSDVE